MTDIHDIINQLEQRRSGIARALAALRAVGEGGATSPRRPGRPKKSEGAPGKTKRKLSPEGRARIIAALKKRWAAKKKAAKG
jgi:hypothetical protein